ncbi:MAG TPA: tetratricopeptide repeat protein [Acetobacteraceae bacterium]|nr:tetratricopeptide repeat protein [Acetobacteraceae bacterium]
MIGWLLRLAGLRKRRRRVYVQSPLPPAAPVRRRHKGEASMPLPPGYIQARGEAPSPPPPAPKRSFGRSSMPLPPGQLQGPSAAAADKPTASASVAGAAARRQHNRALRRRASPALLRKLAKPTLIVCRGEPPPSAAAQPAVVPPVRPAPSWLRARLRRWAPRLRRAGRFGVIYLAPLAVLVVVAGLVLREMRHVGIVVMPIPVPAEVAATGRTPSVLAAHLIDQIDRMRRLTLADRSDRPEGRIPPSPPVGPPAPLLSRRGIASYLRDLFAAPVQRVTADLVTQPDGKLSLRMHMTGAGEIASQNGITIEQIDPAIRFVSAEVWRIANPVLYAWYKTEIEPRPAVVIAAMRSLLKAIDAGQQSVDHKARQTISVLLARAQMTAGDEHGALETLDGLGQPGKLDPAAWAVRATVLLNMGQGAHAGEAQQRVLALAPNSAWAHVSTARFYLSVGKFSDAYKQARTASRIAPDDGAALMLESAALLTLHRVPEAIEAARQAMRLAPSQPGVQEALGNALLATRRPDLALGLYDSELKLHPGRVTALIGRARALQALGHHEDALAATEEALRITPNNGTAMLLRAWSLLALKRPQDALTSFETLLRSRPEMPPLLQGKAAALAALGRNADALVVLKQLNTLVPNNEKLQAEIKRVQGLTK